MREAGGRIQRVDVLCTRFGTKHREDTGSTTNVQEGAALQAFVGLRQRESRGNKNQYVGIQGSTSEYP